MHLLHSVRRAVLAAPLPLLLLGCAPLDVAGSWQGTWRLDDGSASGAITLDVSQSGRNLSGNFSLGGSFCVASGTIDGTLAAHLIDVTLSNGVGGNAHLTGTVDSNETAMDGNFKVTSGLCNGQSGNFHVTR